MSDDNVKPIGVRFKHPASNGEQTLRLVSPHDRDECSHRGGVTYLIREGETEVECGRCRTRLDPMFVLRILATEETEYMKTRQSYLEEMERLKKRQRTKCQHCRQMTRISHA